MIKRSGSVFLTMKNASGFLNFVFFYAKRDQNTSKYDDGQGNGVYFIVSHDGPSCGV